MALEKKKGLVVLRELEPSVERAGARDWAIEAPRPHGREAKAADAAARHLREKKKSGYSVSRDLQITANRIAERFL